MIPLVYKVKSNLQDMLFVEPSGSRQISSLANEDLLHEIDNGIQVLSCYRLKARIGLNHCSDSSAFTT